MTAANARDSELSVEVVLPDASGIRKRALTTKVIPRVAIVHDYLTQRGGAERVVLAMHKAFPDAPIHTALYRPETTFPEFRRAVVCTLPLDRIGLFRRHHRAALPLLAPFFSLHRVAADVVLCSSSGWAHGVAAKGCKLVYCYAPARWLYQADRYLRGAPVAVRVALRVLRPMLVSWDRYAARTADRYLAVSSDVQQRIRDAYGIEARVVHSPCTLTPEGVITPLAEVEQGYFLCVSRLLPYKNVDLLIEALRRRPDRHLVIVGTGPLWGKLQKLAPANVSLLGSVEDGELRWLYRHCRAVISIGYDDYGLTPLEAAAFGKPVMALRAGGSIDVIDEGRTGIFVERSEVRAIVAALSRLDEIRWDAEVLRDHAQAFSEARFIDKLHEEVAEVLGGAPKAV